ncbi:hypothetical protein KCP73_04675 [Salmonella enterica subsp. enterica]|nr:hypothetical protein KCP73_04675 [Salmonella enterica subsp. enterica]
MSVLIDQLVKRPCGNILPRQLFAQAANTFPSTVNIPDADRKPAENHLRDNMRRVPPFAGTVAAPPSADDPAVARLYFQHFIVTLAESPVPAQILRMRFSSRRHSLPWFLHQLLIIFTIQRQIEMKTLRPRRKNGDKTPAAHTVRVRRWAEF